VLLTLWIGTLTGNVQSIVDSGFMPSSSGRLGPGIYLTDDFNVAKTVARHRGKGSNMIVLKVQVKVPRVVELNVGSVPEERHDKNAQWAQKGDVAASGVHPAWLGLAPFKEWVVRDPLCCKVTDIFMLNGVLETGLQCRESERITLHVANNVTINGDIKNCNMLPYC